MLNLEGNTEDEFSRDLGHTYGACLSRVKVGIITVMILRFRTSHNSEQQVQIKIRLFFTTGSALFIIIRINTIVQPFFSSPEPLGSQGELLVYPLSRRPSVVRRCPSSSVHHFQRSSPLKPLGQSKPNFMWSLLGKGERKSV